MCWPSFEGGIEVEERRRRHKNEPRRKRLKFVKDRSSGRRSDEWDLIHPRPHSRREEMEIWEEHHRPHHQLPGPDQRLHIEDPRWAAHLREQQHQEQLRHQQHMMHQQQQMQHQQQQQQQQLHHQQQMHQIPPPPPLQQMGWHPHQDHGNDIVRVEEHEPHHHPRPHIIERVPREQHVARMPSQIRARSRSRVRGHSRGGSGTQSLYSDDTSYRGSHRGRRRPESVYHDDDSFIQPRTMLRRTNTGRR